MDVERKSEIEATPENETQMLRPHNEYASLPPMNIDPYAMTSEELINIKDWMHQQQKTLLHANSWENKKLDSEIESKIMFRADGLFPVVYAKSEIACSSEKLFDYLVYQLSSTCHEWNDVMYYSEVLHRFNDWALIGAGLNNGKPIADREDMFLQIVDKLENQTLMEMSVGFDESQIPLTGKAKRSVVRGKMYFCSKTIKSTDNSSCEYVTVWHYDPAGWASKLLPKRMLGNIVLKNLVHEHQQLRKIFKRNNL